MTIETILTIYSIVTAIVLTTTAIFILTADCIPEIEDFYDWLFYGIFWTLILIKYMIKFFIKLVKT